MTTSSKNPEDERASEEKRRKEAKQATSRVIEDQPGEYLVAPRRHKLALASGVRPMSSVEVQSTLTSLEAYGLKKLRPLKQRKQAAAVLHAGGASELGDSAYVVTMHDDLAHKLISNPAPNLIIERDQHLRYADAPIPGATPPVALGSLENVTFSIQVLGNQDAPVANAQVTVTTVAGPRTGVTNERGQVDIRALNPAGVPVQSLFVKPRTGYWTRNLVNPPLQSDSVNTVRVLSLEETVPGFPASFELGWGQEFMGLTRSGGESGGAGVKVGIIDSGLDARHPCLAHVNHGVDLTNNENRETWVEDVLGHGTHCAGVIGAKAGGGFAFRGFAPQAELHSYKVFPGGKFSALHDAIDLAIHEGMDVLSMSLGGGDPSEAIEQKLEEAVEAGVTCIVAAGNSSGPVQYPASSPNTVAVAAMGRLATFPSGSWDASQVRPPVTSGQIFVPTFTCFGPQVNVTAPGVAIVSTFLDGGFAPDSGTSMATPHVSGLAARLLAEHPAFKSGPGAARGEARVRLLCQLIAEACQRLPFGPEYVGHGVPLAKAS